MIDNNYAAILGMDDELTPICSTGCGHECSRPLGHKGRCDCYRATCKVSLSSYSYRQIVPPQNPTTENPTKGEPMETNKTPKAKKPVTAQVGDYVHIKKTHRNYKCVDITGLGPMFRYVDRETVDGREILLGPVMSLSARKVAPGRWSGAGPDKAEN